jgi:hypothetical protein
MWSGNVAGERSLSLLICPLPVCLPPPPNLSCCNRFRVINSFCRHTTFSTSDLGSTTNDSPFTKRELWICYHFYLFSLKLRIRKRLNKFKLMYQRKQTKGNRVDSRITLLALLGKKLVRIPTRCHFRDTACGVFSQFHEWNTGAGS